MFLDTSGLLHYLDQKSPQHQHARDYVDATDDWLCHELVLAELVALGPRRRVARSRILKFVEDLLDSPFLVFVFVNAEIHEKAIDLLKQHHDKDWSLCDAVSFVLMREHQVQEALNSDHHFEQAGFQRLLNP